MYIQKADEALTVAQISELHPAMCIDYATRMRSINKKKILSKYVSHCIDYIYNNLHTKITMNDLSEHVGLNRSYLSKLFSKEMGISITDYRTVIRRAIIHKNNPSVLTCLHEN